MARISMFLMFLGCVASVHSHCAAQGVELDTSGRSSLVGIKKLGVSVVVNDPEGDAGITAQQVQDDVEIVLQKGGLKVISLRDRDKENDDREFCEFVHFRITMIKVPKHGHAYTVETSVSQVVKIARTNQFVPGSTWSRASCGFGITAGKQPRETAQDHAKALLNDWLKANAASKTDSKK